MLKYILLFLLLYNLYFQKAYFIESKQKNNLHEISIFLESKAPVFAIQFAVEYDYYNLILENIEWNSLTNNSIKVFNEKSDNGIIKFALAFSEGKQINSEIVTLTFKGNGYVKLVDFMINDIQMDIENSKIYLKEKSEF